ncbi:MAG: hypothetical protein HC872_04920 [Gammaproteobacteria bacterium]|nr:hypothetical protein [Gammaproteobacteria bacterium]
MAEGTVDVAGSMDAAPVAEVRLLSGATYEQPPAPVRLAAGQRIVYGEAQPPRIESIDPAYALAWRDGRLAFLDEPLKYVIQDVARYTELRLLIRDAAIEEMRYTGTLMQNEVDDWLISLQQVFPILVERVAADRAILQLRESSTDLPSCVRDPSLEGC